MSNIYEELELFLDPPITGTAEMKTEIEKKLIPDWNKRSNADPRYKVMVAKAHAYIKEGLPDLPSQAAAARSVRLNELKEDVKRARSISTISEKHIKRLLNLYKKYFSEKTILAEIGVFAPPAAPASLHAGKEYAPFADMKGIDADLTVAGKKNLYDLLGLPPNTAAQTATVDLLRKAQTKEQEIHKMPKGEPKVDALNRLAGKLIYYFQNDQRRQMYDIALKRFAFDQLCDKHFIWYLDPAKEAAKLPWQVYQQSVIDTMKAGFNQSEAVYLVYEYYCITHKLPPPVKPAAAPKAVVPQTAPASQTSLQTQRQTRLPMPLTGTKSDAALHTAINTAKKVLLFAGIPLLLLGIAWYSMPLFRTDRVRYGEYLTAEQFLELRRQGTFPKEGAGLELIISTVEFRFRWCPAGTFTMGSPETEAERGGDEAPHRVILSQGFWMGETEVTQEQWEAVMSKTPSHFRGIELPVENVSWNDCREFVSELNKSLALYSFDGYEFALPTEAQWEYACRGGTTTPFHFGSVLNGSKADCDGSRPYGTEVEGTFLRKTADVRSYPANAWGLFDSHGNVSEWCSDWYGEYPRGTVSDPAGAEHGAHRIIRGGGWNAGGMYCRSAFRVSASPGTRQSSIGVRICLVIHRE